MKRSTDIASIRALCSLGLPGEQLIPALLEALHRVISSSRNLFDWTDAQGRLIRYYFEGSIEPEIARHYFEEFHNGREREVMPAFRDSVVHSARVHSAAELDHEDFYRSALYNEIWRPQGLHRRVEAVIHNSRAEPLGSLVLYRGREDPPFTRDEESLLETLVPYIARALEAESALPRDFVRRHERRALLTLSSDGELQQLSQDAHKLLLLAHGGITPESASHSPDRRHFPTLALLVEQLRRNDGLSRPAVSLSVENAWGRFVFEAEPLLSVAARQPAAIHVIIHHDEPRAVVVRRALEALPLSVAQKEVCKLLHGGYKQSEIATIMSVAPSTVADHVKKIYTKLDVHSLHELRLRLEAACPGDR